ncbi:MAG: hypothetical protein IJ724_07625 [Muribaculaceae bacterium]|nr:hypothetical protein [Muribaculaceae bacterium]MBR1726499.1 hypothetical protein [Muribaculaceae bacterium]
MKKSLLLALAMSVALGLTSCKEHYSDGEKVGTLIEFAKSGLFWDSWDGRLNLTQTGMNTAGEPFEFSFDNDRTGQDSLISLMQQAQVEGWKIKIKYHRVKGWNWFGNRGRSDYFVDDMTVLDKSFANIMRQQQGGGGRVVDTVYVVIDKAELHRHLNQ